MGPLELDGATGEEPLGLLKQESMVLLVAMRPLELAGTLK